MADRLPAWYIPVTPKADDNDSDRPCVPLLCDATDVDRCEAGSVYVRPGEEADIARGERAGGDRLFAVSNWSNVPLEKPGEIFRARVRGGAEAAEAELPALLTDVCLALEEPGGKRYSFGDDPLVLAVGLTPGPPPLLPAREAREALLPDGCMPTELCFVRRMIDDASKLAELLCLE